MMLTYNVQFRESGNLVEKGYIRYRRQIALLGLNQLYLMFLMMF